MKKVIYLLLATALLGFSCNQTKKTESDKQTEEKQECAKVLTVDEFIKQAPNMVGEQVTVKGTVDHVCERGGKRLKIFSSDSEKQIHAVASEEIGRFSDELEGTDVCLIGIVTEFKITEENVANYEKRIKAQMKEEDGKSETCEGKVKNNLEGDEHHTNSSDLEQALEKVAKWKKELENSETGYIVNGYFLENATAKVCENKCDEPCNEPCDKPCNKTKE